MLWDTHMHSNFSGDSDTPAEEMILASIKKGLSGICFTDHLDYDYQEEPDLFLLDCESYAKEIFRLQTLYQSQIPILFGIELGLQPSAAKKNQKIASAYPFDFIIGSSHVVNGIDPYYAPFWEGRTQDECYLEYYESILENLSSFQDFDVYGHIDYVIRYCPDKSIPYDEAKFYDIIDEILRKLISQGKGIELNTAGFKYGLGQPNPSLSILKRYHELGGEIITIGADGHKPEHIAYDFSKVPDILKSAGFSYYTVFSKRKPTFIKIP